MFNEGLHELEFADYLVESAMMALVLQELKLVSTKQSLIKVLTEESILRQEIRREFQDR